MFRKLLFLAVVSLVVGMSMVTPRVGAAPSSPVTGLTVSPALKNIALPSGQTKVEFSATLENDTDKALGVTPQATDFSTSGVNGAIDLKRGPDAQHGLASHIAFSSAHFTLEPKKSYTLHIAITDAAVLGAGGHFTAIRYQAVAQDSQWSSVNMHSELVSFLFVSTAGQAHYDLKAQWSLPRFVFGSIPQDTAMLFTNAGNTQSAPHGTITISGPPHSRRVAQGVLNANSSLVLPGATRLLQTELPAQRLALMPGWYAANMYYRAGEGEGYQHIGQRFFFVGWLFILGVGALLVLLGCVLYWLSSRRRKHRRAANPERKMNEKDAKPVKSRTIPVKHL